MLYIYVLQPINDKSCSPGNRMAVSNTICWLFKTRGEFSNGLRRTIFVATNECDMQVSR